MKTRSSEIEGITIDLLSLCSTFGLAVVKGSA